MSTYHVDAEVRDAGTYAPSHSKYEVLITYADKDGHVASDLVYYCGNRQKAEGVRDFVRTVITSGDPDDYTSQNANLPLNYMARGAREHRRLVRAIIDTYKKTGE